MTKDMVSIIMPTYNRAKVILRSIKSVLRQTYSNYELIIIDDGSSDETAQVISNIGNDRIQYLKLPQNQGACYARNQGLMIAEGEYIAFLDSDNVWEKDYLECRILHLKKAPANVGGVFGCMKVIWQGKYVGTSPSEKVRNSILHSRSNDKIIRHMLFDNIIDTNTMVLKKKCVDSIAGFNENLRRMQDWEYFFRILYQSGYRIKFVDDCLIRHYTLSDSITRKGNYKAYWDTRVIFLKQFKDVLEHYGCYDEVICHLCLKMYPYLDEGSLYKILDTVDVSRYKSVISLMRQKYEKQILRYQRLAELNAKSNAILDVQRRWILLKQRGINFSTILDRMGYRDIAIYGYGYLGKTLYSELAGTDHSIVYIIDKFKKGMTDEGLEIIRPNDFIMGIDAVIVTALVDYEQIRKKYQKDIPFVSILSIIEFAENEIEQCG